ERDAPQRVLLRQAQRMSVARGERFRFAAAAALPDGTDAVDDVARFQAMAARHFRLAGASAAQGPAFREQLRARAAVDGAVHAAAAEQRLVRGVDDGIDVEERDVPFGHFDHALLPLWP